MIILWLVAPSGGRRTKLLIGVSKHFIYLFGGAIWRSPDEALDRRFGAFRLFIYFCDLWRHLAADGRSSWSALRGCGADFEF